MRPFINMRVLQAIDSTLLILLLGILAMLLWFSLGDITSNAQHNQQQAAHTLQKSYQAFQSQMALESLVDAQREAFDALDEAFFQFALNPNSSKADLPKLQELANTLQQQSLQMLSLWPAAGGLELKEQFEEISGIMSNLVTALDALSPDHRKQLANDAHNTSLQARELMEQLEGMDDELGEQVAQSIQQSIQQNANLTTDMMNRLDTIKQRFLVIATLLMVGLIISHSYFSGSFKRLLATAQHAQSVAEEAVKTKARFLATMSHEIRTPMNGVIGMTHLLMNTPMSKKQTEFVESIHLSGEHLLTVINDVLDFSKIEAGKLDLKREPLELRACIEDVFNLLASKAMEKNLELAYAVDPAIPLFIEGDTIRLRQILTNLIGNAIKFTEQGEITVFVIPSHSQGDEYELEFQIKDTGAGIPADRLENIFEQFSQADNIQTRRSEGTGLGLAISRRLVQMMEGNIWAESTVGVGSCFHFTLKTRTAHGKLKPFLHPNIPEITGKRILIVENNTANYQALQDFCSGWGSVAQACGTASEAIAMIASGHTYDIALVDSNLPNAAALDFGKYVRSHYSKQEFPLILIAPPNDHHAKDTVRELFNLYLTKPLTRSRLFDSLMTVLGELNLVTTRPETCNLKLGERLPLAILLAEDNPINQIVAASILDEMAYKADIAENGQQALEALRKKPYDVIFMDMQMPEMDGLEATRRIRAEFPADHQPIIIAMTANAMKGDRQECLQAGMNDYISKPVLPEAVATALQHWCTPNNRSQPREEANHAITSH